MTAVLFPVIRRFFVPLSLLSYLFGSAYTFLHAWSHQGFGLIQWLLTQYHINYIDFGFAKRAMVGTMLYPVMQALPDGEAPEYFAFLFVDFVLFLAIVYIAHSALKRVGEEHTGFADWFRLLLLIAPVGFVQYASDSGRYDHYNYLLVFLAAYLVLNRKLAWGGAILALGALVHEAIFFYGVPIISILAFLQSYKFREVALSLLPVTVVMAAVFLYGNLEVDLASVLGEKVAAGAEVWSRGVLEPAENLGLFDVAGLIFYTVLPYYFFFRFFEENRLPLILVGCQMFFVCALFLLGIDYARWAHLVFFSCATVVISLLCHDQKLRLPSLNGWEKIVFALYLVPAGPLGTTHPLPYVSKIAEKLFQS
ncbi:hypothetical protein [Roseibium sp. MMSF_3544]|uniref:hypothetical protein n=1 Tax=unclassified Roseibium TaxID=2629323 RepID=UPI00273D73F4|nr:hypothetical protein [Roseibium sp. MMSF_3544]